VTPFLAKLVFVLGAVTWSLIRAPHQRRAWKTATRVNNRTLKEKLLLTSSLSGLGIIPFAYAAFGFPASADYAFNSTLAWLGAVIFIGALWLFYATHRTLGRNWSDSLEVRESHTLVTGGPYRLVRHPMYSAFFLWAVAQALLLPNWVAGFAGLVGFGVLFLFRVDQEERLMLETFGEQYRRYMDRTARVIPWIY
jgi:protein-S-isoprenylcysteine O-methyltransferase Ste14